MSSNEQNPVTSRRGSFPEGFTSSMKQNWATQEHTAVQQSPAASWAKARRAQLASHFPNSRIVISAGAALIRNNDMEFPFRPSSEFTYLTGWGVDAVPGSLLIIETHETGVRSEYLHTIESEGAETSEYYENSLTGEFWVGPRKSLEEIEKTLDLATYPLAVFSENENDITLGRTASLEQHIDEMRVFKDEYEIAELTEAVRITADGFQDVVTRLSEAQAHQKGERIIEGIFHLRARAEGNREGYGTIAAAGANACYLHWMQNTGQVKPGELLLLDAGVEVDSLYTADITRTIPISGSFTPVQRRVYEAVLEATDAAFAAATIGAPFRSMHHAAMTVIAHKLAEWGILGVSPEVALDSETGGQHRRYMIHGTSHHLGLDVHDCATARDEMYMDALLVPGMVFTIEPGLYFHQNDLSVPEEYRGIGIRIEDDIVMTANGPVNLSASIPRTIEEIETWVSANR